jgi:hypothetical protein
MAINIFSIFYERMVDALIKRVRFGEPLLTVIVILLAAAGCYYLFFYQPDLSERSEKSHVG